MGNFFYILNNNRLSIMFNLFYAIFFFFFIKLIKNKKAKNKK